MSVQQIVTRSLNLAKAFINLPWMLYVFYVLVSPFMLVGFTAGLLVGFVVMAVGAVKVSWKKGLEVFNNG